MNENQLSQRLVEVSKYIPKDSRLADIGSDHAYLPVAMALQGKILTAIAGEVVKGPFEAATKQVQKNGLENQITVRLANGLDAITKEDQITTITICGMGGTLIREILEAGWKKQRIQGNERLILQPNVGEHSVREWLVIHGYTILEETILEENQKIYEIIVAERQATRTAYSPKEQLFGPILLTKKSPVFQKKWKQELKQRQFVLEKLQQATKDQGEKKEQIKKEINEIKEVLIDGD